MNEIRNYEIKVVHYKDLKYSKQCYKILKKYPHRFENCEKSLYVDYIVCETENDKVLAFATVKKRGPNQCDLSVEEVVVDTDEKGKFHEIRLMKYIKRHSKGAKRVCMIVKKDDQQTIQILKNVSMKIIEVCDEKKYFKFAIDSEKVANNERIRYNVEEKDLS